MKFKNPFDPNEYIYGYKLMIFDMYDTALADIYMEYIHIHHPKFGRLEDLYHIQESVFHKIRNHFVGKPEHEVPNI